MHSTPQGSHTPTPASTSEEAPEANASVLAATPDAADGARAAQIDATASGDGATALGDDATASGDERWEVMWCYVGWYDVADRLERMLPPWAYLKRMAPGTPLSQQVWRTDVLIPTTGCVGSDVINAAPRCKLIAQPAAGTDNIALDTARARGIPVTAAPGSNAQSVAEAALMMMLMLARRVEEARAVFASRRIGEPVGMELCGKTLGIIGLGSVGLCLQKAAEGLGMKVVGTTSQSTREQLEQLLRSSHIVSIHCPLTPATRGLIGPAELAMMRPGALIINCARGPVINKDALLQALEGGHLGGAGLDVHWVEPADPTEPLYQHPRVLALPHMGTITNEVYQRFAEVLYENIVRVHDGRELLNRVC